MSVAQLENILLDLPSHAKVVRQDPGRQLWRFEAGSKAYYLKFYPRRGMVLQRMIRSNPAMKEFGRLQTLQKAKIAAPRAIAMLAGYTVSGVKGDALIVEAIEPSVTLDRYLNDFERQGKVAPDHLELSRQIREIVRGIGEAGFGHDDLNLGNLLRREDGKVFLLDVSGITPGWWKMRQLFRLGRSVERYATRSDIRRAWNLLAAGREMPKENTASPKFHSGLASLSRGENDCIGRATISGWQSHFFKQWKLPYRWSPASALHISKEDWERQWPQILESIAQNKLEVLKTSSSGDVLATQITLGDQSVDIVIKRPRRKFWYRYFNEIGRGSRAARAWKKAWHLIARDLPTAWPLAMFERKVLGYTVDQFIINERVPGPTMYEMDLNSFSAADRQTLLRRCGRVLRRIETTGLSHFDSKSTNWIVKPDDKMGPIPVLVDVDGVRFYRWDTFGIRRLLRAMRDHPAYTVADSLELCQGYAPFSRMEQEVTDA